MKYTPTYTATVTVNATIDARKPKKIPNVDRHKRNKNDNVDKIVSLPDRQRARERL